MARKKASIHYIYKTTCNVTNRYYIGMHSTNNIQDCYMGSGKRLRHSIRKYGAENHTKEILEFLQTREELILREIEIVTKELVEDPMCMNLREGGTGGFTVEQQRLNAKKSKQKQKILRETNPEWVKNKSEKISSTNKKNNDSGHREKKYFYDWGGKKHRDENKKLIGEKNSIKQQGHNNSQYGTCWITKDGLNKKIKKEDIDSFIRDGWNKGRKLY